MILGELSEGKIKSWISEEIGKKEENTLEGRVQYLCLRGPPSLHEKP